VSELFNYRDEHSDLEPASDADETEEGALADTWNPNLTPRPFIRSTTHPLSAAPMLYLGTLLYVGTLLINALAVLNEERFLARSSHYYISRSQLLV